MKCCHDVNWLSLPHNWSSLRLVKSRRAGESSQTSFLMTCGSCNCWTCKSWEFVQQVLALRKVFGDVWVIIQSVYRVPRLLGCHLCPAPRRLCQCSQLQRCYRQACLDGLLRKVFGTLNPLKSLSERCLDLGSVLHFLCLYKGQRELDCGTVTHKTWWETFRVYTPHTT